MMSMERTVIRDACIDLAVGDTERIMCPYCMAKHEQSMRITRAPEGLHAKCYRAKCGKYAFVPSTPQHKSHKPLKKFEARAFSGTLIEIPPSVYEEVYDRYGLVPEELAGMKYCADHNLLHMPIRNIYGYEIGAQTKCLGDPGEYPKAITYFYNDTHKAHFEWPHIFDTIGTARVAPTDTIVIVEDILSAIKVARMLPACALLSHTMTPDVANLLATNFNTVLMLLDPDALMAAMRTKKKYSLLFGNFLVRQLSNDPKDTPWEELKEVLSGATNPSRCGTG
jgi:hypothetical protein